MSNLTKKWKSGGLEKNKKYYTTDKLGRSYIKTYNKKGFKGLVHEVLAPVPSYEEYMCLVDYKEELTKACKMRDEIIKKYEDIDSWWQAENQKLKELLDECRDLMNKAGYVFAKIEDVEKARNLLTQIDEALKW